MVPVELARVARALVRQVLWHRRLAAAVLAGAAVVAGISAVAPRQATVAIWTAARDLPGGRPLTQADLIARALPSADVPDGALRATARVVGRLVAAPMRRGEPFTDVRLLEPALLSALGPGLVAVPVRVADGSAAAALVHPGDVVDVIAATDPTDGPPAAGAAAPGAPVAAGVRVLAVPGRDDGGSGDGAGLVVVAATGDQAGALARAASSARLSLVLERP